MFANLETSTPSNIEREFYPCKQFSKTQTHVGLHLLPSYPQFNKLCIHLAKRTNETRGNNTACFK